MGNYLTIISRSDFSDFYKFGHIFVHNLVPFEGNLCSHADDKCLFDAVTAYMNTYEYSTEYLLLHIRRTVFAGNSVEIFVKDIVGVYALNSEAQVSLAVSLDSRIKIQNSMWESFFTDLNRKQAIRQSNAGKYNCFEIFQISDEERNAVKKLIPNDLVEEIYSDLYNHKRPTGNRSLWNYLIRYERHCPYWNDTRGFFSDAIHVYESYRKGQEIDYEIADECPAGDIIAKCGAMFNELYETLTSSHHNTYRVDGCNYLAVAPLYLYLKMYFKDGGITPASFNQNKDLYVDLHRKFGLDFAIAVALLGITLGHNLTYSCYYQIKNLGIFTSNADTNNKITHPETGDSLTDEEAQSLINDLYNQVKNHHQGLVNNITSDIRQVSPLANVDLLDDIDNRPTKEDIPSNQDEEARSSANKFPIVMKKLTPNKNKFCTGRKAMSKTANNEKEYQALIQEDYAPEDYFTKSQLFK